MVSRVEGASAPVPVSASAAAAQAFPQPRPSRALASHAPYRLPTRAPNSPGSLRLDSPPRRCAQPPRCGSVLREQQALLESWGGGQALWDGSPQGGQAASLAAGG
jgi:hypothetical protein